MKKFSTYNYSCATHFGSPRAKNDGQALYQLLLRAKVYETDSIIGSIEHTLDGETVIINVSKTNIHIEESSEGLKIYVPKDSKDQEMCYLRQLPTKLFNETMMAELDNNSNLAFDSTAVSIITAIFASSDEVVDLVLEEAGIVPVPYPDQYEGEIQQSQQEDVLPSPGIDQQQSAESETASGIATPDVSSFSTRSNSFSATATSSRLASYHPNVTSPSIQLRGSPQRPSSGPVLPETAPHHFMPENSRVEYLRLLGNIITAARNKRGAFPWQGVFNLDALLNALPVEAVWDVNNYDLPFGVRNKNQLNHDIEVGAAGELYVRTNTFKFEQKSHMHRHLKYSPVSRLLFQDSVVATGRAQFASMSPSMRITMTWHHGAEWKRRILYTMILRENSHSF